MEISQNFVAFSEYMNFTYCDSKVWFKKCWGLRHGENENKHENALLYIWRMYDLFVVWETFIEGWMSIRLRVGIYLVSPSKGFFTQSVYKLRVKRIRSKFPHFTINFTWTLLPVCQWTLCFRFFNFFLFLQFCVKAWDRQMVV